MPLSICTVPIRLGGRDGTRVGTRLGVLNSCVSPRGLQPFKRPKSKLYGTTGLRSVSKTCLRAYLAGKGGRG